MTSVQLAMGGESLDYPNALVDSVMTKISTGGASDETATPEPLGKCMNPATGKPVSARRDAEALLPAPGTVESSEDGNGTGRCPECATTVKLSSKGFITAHTVRRENIPQPPPTVRLAERQTAVTDTGVHIGSPDTSERSRDAELSGVAFRDWHPPMILPGPTVKIVMRKPKGDGKGYTTETVEVPGTEQNVRTALRQEQRKKQRVDKKTGELVGGPDPKLLRRYADMLKGLTGLAATGSLGYMPGAYRLREAACVDAPHAPQGREERAEGERRGHVPTSPGPAMFKGPAMSGAIPTERDRTTKKGKPRNGIGWSGALGRERIDRIAVSGNAEACQGKGCTLPSCTAVIGGRYGYMECRTYRTLSKTRARHYWSQVKRNKERDRAARERAARLKDAPGYPRDYPGYGHIPAPSAGRDPRVGGRS